MDTTMNITNTSLRPAPSVARRAPQSVRTDMLPRALFVSELLARRLVHVARDSFRGESGPAVLSELAARVYDHFKQKEDAKRAAERKTLVGSGDRSERIRTYNFPQNRLTDHRINYTRHNLPAVMDGDVKDMTDACRTYYAAEALREASAGDDRGN